VDQRSKSEGDGNDGTKQRLTINRVIDQMDGTREDMVTRRGAG
jgi:hypothetical protein